MDVVVTLPKTFGLDRWIAEGDPAGAPWSGTEYGWFMGGRIPDIEPGERVYVVYNNRLRGYSPLVRVEEIGAGVLWRTPKPRNFGRTLSLPGVPASPGAIVEIEPEYDLAPHRARFALIRHGGAVAVTIDEPIPGFRGWRYRWWPYDLERPFPEWQTP